MDRKKLIEAGWKEKKEFWMKKGEFGTWLMTKTYESVEKGNIIVNKKKDGA